MKRFAAATAIVAGVLSAFSLAEASVVTAAIQPAQEGSCHPAYSPCLPIVGDLNCTDLSSDQKPVTILVIGVDPYLLDNDWTTATSRDGIGCETPAGSTTTTTAATTTSPTTTAATPTTASPTTTVAAPTTTAATQDQDRPRLARTGFDVLFFVVIGVVLIDAGYVTLSSGRRVRNRRSRQ